MAGNEKTPKDSRGCPTMQQEEMHTQDRPPDNPRSRMFQTRAPGQEQRMFWRWSRPLRGAARLWRCVVVRPLRVSLLLVSFAFVACTPTLENARKAYKAGQHEQALRAYRVIARSQQPQALDAQLALVRHFSGREKWNDLISESSRLAGFLDPEDNWYQSHRRNARLWQRAQEEIPKTLIAHAVHASKKAKEHGSPGAYIASGRLYGLYLEREPKGDKRVQAAVGRGTSLAVRGACKEALPWFARGLRWAKAGGKKKNFAPGSAADRALRGSLSCRLKLWRLEQLSSTKKRKVPSMRSFAPIGKQIEEYLRRSPQRGPTDAMRWASMFQRDGMLPQALQLLLAIVQYTPKHPAIPLAKRSALICFGLSRRWGPLLALVQRYLDATPDRDKERFSKRLRTLVVIQGLRQARAMLKQGRVELAAKRYLAIQRIAPNYKGAILALYQGALALEEAKSYPAAEKLYISVYQRNAKHRLAPMSLYRYAVVLRKQKRLREAGRWFVFLARKFRREMIAPRALYEAYQAYTQAQSPRRARRARWRLLRFYPLSMEAKRLRKRRRAPQPR